MKVLQIIESAYRGTLEEQDDTIVWLTACLQAAGADVTVLLKDNAVNYVVTGEDGSGLRFGAWTQTNPPRIAEQIAQLLARHVRVHAVREDLARRGLSEAHRLDGVRLIEKSDIPQLTEEHDRVLHW
jgi:sulfur transfer complex TusBCD TusB component (DsrH family)